MPKDTGPNTARSEQFADFQSDAPACDNCGSITVRAGNCYLCHNCGSSMGCMICSPPLLHGRGLGEGSSTIYMNKTI